MSILLTLFAHIYEYIYMYMHIYVGIHVFVIVYMGLFVLYGRNKRLSSLSSSLKFYRWQPSTGTIVTINIITAS